ncbi:GNAT family N-acetyltransferase [Agromyces sp. NPDC057679]|uniref:GNAT family N-acetyltransferase n=1 Tax=Agromyces sp. NPDC057679 TaxID=3346207 RepID=UPI00366F01B5
MARPTASRPLLSPADSGIRVRVASTPAEAEALRPVWESLRGDALDADLDHVLAVAAGLPQAIAPHIVLVERDGASPLMVMARLEDHRFVVRAGYRTVADLGLRTVVVSFDGVLGARSDADRRLAIRALRRALDDRTADAVLLQKVDCDGPIEQAALAAATPFTRIHGMVRTTHRFAELPDTLDEMLLRRSAGAPKEARFKDRRLRRRYPDAVRLERIDDAGIERIWSDVETVAAASYQRTIGVGAERTPLSDALATLAVERGWARIWMLYLGDAPVAFWWGTLYRGTLSVDVTAFDRAYAKDRVGTSVMYAMFDELCRDPSARTIDFGHGDAEYKRDYATSSVDQRDVVLLAARPKALAVGALLSLLQGARTLAYALFGSTSWASRLRDAARKKGSASGG